MEILTMSHLMAMLRKRQVQRLRALPFIILECVYFNAAWATIEVFAAATC